MLWCTTCSREMAAVLLDPDETSGRSPAYTAITSANGERLAQHGVGVAQQVVDVAAGRRRMVQSELPVRVGGPDDPAVAPGEDEQDALLRGKDQRAGRVDAVARHHDVHALGRPHLKGIGDAGEALHLGGPDPRAVDDDAGTHVELVAALQVAQMGAGHLAALVPELDDLHGRDAGGPVGEGRAGQGDGEAGVVHLRVVVADAAGEGVVPERGHGTQTGRVGEVPVARHRRVHAGERVVERQTGAHVQAVLHAVLQRQQERRGVDEVRRQRLDEQAPLVQRLADEREIELLEVAQAAVDELAGAAGGAGREVALLHQRDGEPPAGRVQGDAAAGDAAADHQHVEVLGGEPLQLSLARVTRRRTSRDLVVVAQHHGAPLSSVTGAAPQHSARSSFVVPHRRRDAAASLWYVPVGWYVP